MLLRPLRWLVFALGVVLLIAIMMMSLSSWNFLVLQARPRVAVFLYTALGIGVVGLLEWWLIRRVRG